MSRKSNEKEKERDKSNLQSPIYIAYIIKIHHFFIPYAYLSPKVNMKNKASRKMSWCQCLTSNAVKLGKLQDSYLNKTMESKQLNGWSRMKDPSRKIMKQGITYSCWSQSFCFYYQFHLEEVALLSAANLVAYPANMQDLFDIA